MLNQHRKSNLTEKCQTCIWAPHLMSTPKIESIPERLLRRIRLKKTRRRPQRRRHTPHSISSVDLKILAELKTISYFRCIFRNFGVYVEFAINDALIVTMTSY